MPQETRQTECIFAQRLSPFSQKIHINFVSPILKRRIRLTESLFSQMRFMQHTSPHPLDQFLFENAPLSELEKHTTLMERALHPHKPLSEIILEKSTLSIEDVLGLLSEKTGLSFLTGEDILERGTSIFDKDKAALWQAIALTSEDQNQSSLPVAFVDFENLPLRDEVAAHFGLPVTPFIITRRDFSNAFEHFYGGKEAQSAHSTSQGNSQKSSEKSSGGIALLEDILSKGIRANASDIHIQPEQDRLLIKHRIDGILSVHTTLSTDLYASLLSSLKVVAHLDVGEHRKPQHGRYLHPFAGRVVDVRMSTHPTLYGENIVMRILDKRHGLKSINELGFSKKMCADLCHMIKRPSGMIIFTGPTGSGKTTTLYALLKELDHPSLNIMTLEDPVEYHIFGIRQTEVTKNMNYAAGIRSLLRQDPDVILVGEIRDEETAAMALRASMTGHLVLTTLHTPDIFTLPARLRDLGVPMDVLAANLLCVVGQRLVRTYCTSCKGKGCKACDESGYKGRITVGEYMMLTGESRQAMKGGGDLTSFASITLAQDGQNKIDGGLTSKKEIERVCGE